MRENVLHLPPAGVACPIGQHHEGDQLVARQLAEDSVCPSGSELVRREAGLPPLSGVSWEAWERTAQQQQLCFFASRYMQSFQELLEFRDRNANDEKVTYE